MPGDRTNPTVGEIREAWEIYRDITFTQIEAASWIWSAAHEFDFTSVGLHLLTVPEVNVDVGLGAFALHAFGALHLVPLGRMTAGSLEHLQPRVEFQLLERRAELRRLQATAEVALAKLVQARFAVFIQPPAGDYGQKTH